MTTHMIHNSERWRMLLEQVVAVTPTIRRALESAREMNMRQYVQQLADFPAQVPLSDPRDVNRAAEAQLTPVLGAQTAKKAAECFPGAALTANHHGVDCFAQCVQGNLLYREMLKVRGVEADVIPVVACSSVPMDNASYGKGLQLFDTLDRVHPLKLPILSNKANSCIVGLYPAMEESAIRKAMAAFETEKYQSRLSEEMRGAVRHVLGDCYLDPQVLGMKTYVQQATAINYKLTQEGVGCGFAYLDLEKLTGSILAQDLTDKTSLAARMLTEKPLREALMRILDGATGCWKLDALKGGRLTGSGTAFFWAAEAKFTRTPMRVAETGLENLRSGEVIAWEEIPQALAEGRIYPALLLCFTTLLFARGIRCYGGYFQPEYLRVMQNGIVRALEEVGDAATASVLAQRDPSGYICGPIFLSGDHGEPVGIIEMIARRMTAERIDRLMETNFEDAHRATLANVYADIIPAAQRMEGYEDILAELMGSNR